jgi:hypothetical protein
MSLSPRRDTVQTMLPPTVTPWVDHSSLTLCVGSNPVAPLQSPVTESRGTLRLTSRSDRIGETLNIEGHVQKSMFFLACHWHCYPDGPPWMLPGPESSGSLWRWSFSQSPWIRGQVWAERANLREIRLRNLIPKPELTVVGQTLGNPAPHQLVRCGLQGSRWNLKLSPLETPRLYWERFRLRNSQISICYTCFQSYTNTPTLAHLDFLFMVIIFVYVCITYGCIKNYPKHGNIKHKGSLFH